MIKKEENKRRCGWCNMANPSYVAYHDHEWGVPVHDDGKLFEMLLLETFQAGLSWECILNKREAFREAFDGFDYEAIEKAAKSNLRGNKIRGGSTISQQTAKNVFLWPGRSWVRKGLEAYFTALIELMWSKQRIMEVYLNSIEMGPGIYGVEAVARDNFGKNASDLFRDECALIAATLPNPIRFSSKNPSSYMLKRKRQIERQMRFIPSFPKEGEDYDPKTSSGGVYRNND